MPSSTIATLNASLAGRYVLERELGQGGMATVYLAEDVRHRRRVAVKVLRPELAAAIGAERFVQEITTTAALQHPHILPLFDSGEAGGFLYYVMPFIDGETLRARLDRESQLAVPEAVRIASDVAEALQLAHTHGVIHRDIKPENILLANGRPMVADFGIALAVSAAGGGRMTETGLTLGTPHYMSPEQATAEKEITARSDVYSLGTVLYEMLAGQPPHRGGSAQQIIMRIVTEEAAPVTQYRKSVPPNVAGAVAKSLEKLPADRFASAAAFAGALADPSFRHAGSEDTAVVPSRTGAKWKRAAMVLALAVVAAAVGATGGRALWRTDPGARDVGLPPRAPIQMAGQFRTYAVSRDGSFIVYLARVGDGTQLWYRSLSGTDAHPIPGTDGAGGMPRLSPDGKRVVFQVGGELKVGMLAGGTATTIARVQDPQGGDWLADDRVFFADDDGGRLRWIDAGAGPERNVGVAYCVNPQLVRSDRVLCGGGADHFAFTIDLDEKQARTPVRTADSSGALVGSHFRLIDEQYLVYMSVDGTLMGAKAVRSDPLTVRRSVELVPMVRRSGYSGAGQFDIAGDGTLTYVPGINADVGQLIRLARDGRATQLPVAPDAYLRFAASPDGRRLATVSQALQNQELKVFDLESGTQETLDAAFFIGAPTWSPDGAALAYVKRDNTSEESVLVRRLDSPDRPRSLLTRPRPFSLQVSSWLTPDLLLVGALPSALAFDLTHSPLTIDTIGVHSFFASISPDRKWVAYQKPGVSGVHLQPWPALDRLYLVDPEGTEPRWASDSELVYLAQYRSEGVIAASVYRSRIGRNARTPFGPRELVVRDPRFADTAGWSVALVPGGGLIYLQSPSDNLGFYLRVIPDWVRQMKRAVDAGSR